MTTHFAPHEAARWWARRDAALVVAGRRVVDDVLRALREHTEFVAPFAAAVIAKRPGRPDVQAVARELQARGSL